MRRRLGEERCVWLTMVGADGTPQPNPVWFWWDGGDDLLTYNRADAHRLRHLAARPRVTVHFNSDGAGMDVVVLPGTAAVDREAPPPDAHPGFASKYRDGMARVSGSPEAFAAAYPVPVRVRVTKVRGY